MKAKEVNSKKFKVGQICYDIDPSEPSDLGCMRMKLINKTKGNVCFIEVPNKKFSVIPNRYGKNLKGNIPFCNGTKFWIFRLKK